MLKIGWSTKNISTDSPVLLTGQFHMRISKGCFDSLYLCSLVVDDGNDTAIFLSADAIFYPAGLIDEIRQKVSAKNSEIDTSKILLNATHTHCSPKLIKGGTTSCWGNLSDFEDDNLGFEFPDNYRNFFINTAADAVCEAYESRCEGSFAYGYGYAVAAHSRRSVYTRDMSVVQRERNGESTDSCSVFSDSNNPNGHAVMYGKTNDEYFSNYESGADHFANFMFTFDKNDALTGAIINIPCPSQLSESEEYLTADYWHEVRTLIKEKYGNIHIMPQCAAAGDLSPRTLHYGEAQSRRFRLKYENIPHDARRKSMSSVYSRLDIAERIKNAFDEVYSWAAKEKFSNAKVCHSVKTVMLERRIVTEEEHEAITQENAKYIRTPYEYAGSLRDYTRPLAEYHRRLNVLKRYEAQKNSPYEKVQIHTVRIGDIAFSTNPFELYVDYQHRIQARSPFTQTFIVQLCAQPEGYVYHGYLPTKTGEANKGYSASVFCNPISPSGGDRLVEETLDELNKLKD